MATFNCHPRNRRLTAEEVRFCEDMFQVKNLKKCKILILNLKFIFSLLKTKGKVRDIRRLAQQKFFKKINPRDLHNLRYMFNNKAREGKLSFNFNFLFSSFIFYKFNNKFKVKVKVKY